MAWLVKTSSVAVFSIVATRSSSDCSSTARPFTLSLSKSAEFLTWLAETSSVAFTPRTFLITGLPLPLLTLPLGSILIDSLSADFTPSSVFIDRTMGFRTVLSLILLVDSMLIDRTTGFAPMIVRTHKTRAAAHNLRSMTLHVICGSNLQK